MLAVLPTTPSISCVSLSPYLKAFFQLLSPSTHLHYHPVGLEYQTEPSRELIHEFQHFIDPQSICPIKHLLPAQTKHQKFTSKQATNGLANPFLAKAWFLKKEGFPQDLKPCVNVPEGIAPGLFGVSGSIGVCSRIFQCVHSSSTPSQCYTKLSQQEGKVRAVLLPFKGQ